MRTYLQLALLLVAGSASVASAQATPAPATMRLSVDEAVQLALENNPGLKADRLDPRISDTRVAVAAGAFKPTVATSLQRNNQLLPPTGFLVPTPTRNDVVTSSAGFGQRLPWFGTTYSMAWNTTHTSSDSFLNSYNPLLQSGLSLNVSQPLIRDLSIDSARLQLSTSRVNRDIAGTRLNESVVRTTADVKTAYWGLVSARSLVDARQKALELADELVRINKAKVDVGQSPPLDLVSAQAEVASNQERLIVAQAFVKDAEDRLRVLILDTTNPESWRVELEPTDTPPVGLSAPDIDGAVTRALQDRTDLVRSRKEIDNSKMSLSYARNQRLPDVRINAGYQASGLGGTQVLRSGGFPGTIVGSGDATNFGSVMNQLFASDFPTWTVGVSISYPIGQSTEDANHARAQLEVAQTQERLKSTEARAIQQVRDAGRKIETNAKRIETARLARELAAQRFDAEQKRLDVGMSTNFLVIQAQRDLTEAKTNELAAILAYDLALVDFEALQQAPPAGTQGSNQNNNNGGSSQGAAPAGTPAAVRAAGPAGLALVTGQ